MITYKEIVDFPNYRIGTDGSVWSAKRKGGNNRSPGKVENWRPMKIHPDRKGYSRVTLAVVGKTISRLVHRLVLETFIGPCPSGMEACHYPDTTKSNCKLDNLRWDTHAENAKDVYRDRVRTGFKMCRRCLKLKPESDFYSDNRASDGLQGYCKGCHTVVASTSRSIEKKRASNREWMRNYRAEKAAK